MILHVKNIHSIVHHKDKLFTVLDYPRNFGNVTQGLMRTIHWAAYYLTNPNPWYPVPEHARILSAIPAIQPLPPVPKAPQSIQKMRDLAETFVAAVRQLSVKQETTMARAGTSRRTFIREKFSRSNRSASNALTSRRSSKKTAGNKTKMKMEYWSTIPRVMMTFHLWNERLIFTSEEIPASEEVFASTEELCSVNFS